MKIAIPSSVTVSLIASTAAIPQGDDIDTANGRCFIGGAQISWGAGVNAYFQLSNPAASGIVVYLDVLASRNSVANALILPKVGAVLPAPSTSNSSNKLLGGPAPVALVQHQATAAAVGGTNMYTLQQEATQPGGGVYGWQAFKHPMRLNEGQSITVSHLVASASGFTRFEWREYVI